MSACSTESNLVHFQNVDSDKSYVGLANESLPHEDAWRDGYIDPCFLDLGSNCR
jgi:hypothetical protein